VRDPGTKRSFTELAEVASRLDEAGFCEAFPAPCFVSSATLENAGDEDPFRTRATTVHRLRPDSTLVLSWDEATESSRTAREPERPSGGDALVASFLVKSSRNPFLGMITVGRAGNNDIVLNHPAISKMHAHVTRAGSRWELDDAHSSNGTLVNRAPLAAGIRVALTDRSIVRFGPSVNVQFHTPAGLYHALLRSPGPIRPAPGRDFDMRRVGS
jgi:hypothetical protein